MTDTSEEQTRATSETLVLLHGSGDSARTWQPLTQRLTEYQCVPLDLPGHGTQVGNPGLATTSVADYADAVHEELVRHGLSSVCLAGHSLGGAIALSMAVTFPQLVSRLVLVGTGARLRVAPQLLEAAQVDPDAATKTLYAMGFAPGHEALADASYQERERPAAGMLYCDLSACNAFDIMDKLSSITQPALIITGADDQLTPPKYAHFLQEHLGNATLALVPQAGHFVHYEQPDAVAHTIEQWLGQ